MILNRDQRSTGISGSRSYDSPRRRSGGKLLARSSKVAALLHVENNKISEELLNAEKKRIIELRSFQPLVNYHNIKQKQWIECGEGRPIFG